MGGNHPTTDRRHCVVLWSEWIVPSLFLAELNTVQIENDNFAIITINWRVFSGVPCFVLCVPTPSVVHPGEVSVLEEEFVNLSVSVSNYKVDCKHHAKGKCVGAIFIEFSYWTSSGSNVLLLRLSHLLPSNDWTIPELFAAHVLSHYYFLATTRTRSFFYHFRPIGRSVTNEFSKGNVLLSNKTVISRQAVV